MLNSIAHPPSPKRWLHCADQPLQIRFALRELLLHRIVFAGACNVTSSDAKRCACHHCHPQASSSAAATRHRSRPRSRNARGKNFRCALPRLLASLTQEIKIKPRTSTHTPRPCSRSLNPGRSICAITVEHKQGWQRCHRDDLSSSLW